MSARAGEDTGATKRALRTRTTVPRESRPKSSRGEVVKLVQAGDSALRAGKVDEALDNFTRAIAADPSHAPAHRGLGSVYVMLGRDGEAAAAYKRYLSLAPNASDAARIQALLQGLN